jgi:hypothetical protein
MRAKSSRQRLLIQVEQLPQSRPLDRLKLAGELFVKDLLRFSASKGTNHEYIVYRETIKRQRTPAGRAAGRGRAFLVPLTRAVTQSIRTKNKLLLIPQIKAILSDTSE